MPAVNDPAQLSKQLAQHALPHYDVEAGDIELLAESNELVFRVTERRGRKYVLRLQEPNGMSDTAVHTQLAWLSSILDATDVLVPRHVPLKSGAPFGMLELPNQKPFRFLLFDWTEGHRLPTPEAWVERDNLFLVGTVVGQMHEHAEHYGLPHDPGVSLLNATTFLGEGSKLRRGECLAFLDGVDLETFYRRMDVVRTAVAECVETDDELGLIHADLGPHNWLFFEGTSSIIDFDAFAVGYFVHDLLGCLWSHSHWEENGTFVKWLFAGYETVRCIDDRVKANVPLLQAAHCFMWINWVVSMQSATIQSQLAGHIVHQLQVIDQLCTTLDA